MPVPSLNVTVAPDRGAGKLSRVPRGQRTSTERMADNFPRPK